MRRVALIILVILLPVSAHAADSTWLKTYTISNNTICPSAPDVCPASTSIDIGFYNPVKNASIYIETLDSPILIYKNTSGVTNPNTYPWDGTVDNKKGVIMPDGVYTVSISATLADGSDMTDTSRTITISSTVGASNNDASTTSDTASAADDSDTSDSGGTTTSSSSGGGGETTYTPPPSALTLDAGANQDAAMDVPLHFSTRTTVKSGAVAPSAKILWGFGDGSSAEGGAVEKTYRYAGAYLVVVTATDGIATGRDEFIVTVRPVQVRILGISGTGIMIANDASERLDLSGWALFAGTGSFRIPSGTVLLPKANILFSSDITKLLTTLDVTLAYPDGVIAGRYAFSPEPVAATTTASVSTFNEQPSSATISYKQVQTVEPIISTKANVQANENAVSAPVAATELAAAGAALPPDTDSSKASPQTSAAGIFKSPWTLGFLGTVILAGAAFIFI